ncbi:MAG TPA: hypothetical protein VM864_01010 [Pyrinomonadaceae bacterium]|jgi:hypothetical protein|nr:hypothetical protein [Pyrinomonadaceae bacterium]
MRTKAALTLIFGAVIVLTVVKLVPHMAVAQSQGAQGSETQTPLPGGDWSLSIGVYTGADAASSPVEVYSVTSDGPKGLVVTNVKVLNRSRKTLTGMKFRWMLFDTRDMKTVVLEGQSDLVPVALSPEERKSLNFRVGKAPFSFAKIHKPLLQYGFLSGSFRAVILADEVFYDDGSAWKWKKDDTSARSYNNETLQEVKIVKAGLTQNSPCTHMGCKYIAYRGEYECTREGSPGPVNCNRGLNYTSCNESVCGTDGSRPPAEEIWIEW